MKLLNATQHNLTLEQVRHARLYCHENTELLLILSLADVDPDLFNTLQNITEDGELKKLALRLLRVVNQFDYVHLPIGSPAFMWIFAQVCAEYYDSGDGVWHQPLQAKILFSYSKRDSVDEKFPDGTVKKRQIFKFEKFVEVQ